jgi:hypothetical protein
MAKIYFSGSITGGRGDVPLYRRIVETLESAGHRVLAGVVTAMDITAAGEAIDNVAIFQRDLEWIREVAESGGILVADVSQPSTGVGYEIAAARYRYGIPVICLYRPAYTKRCTAMISGDAAIETIQYEDAGVDSMLARLIRAIDAADTSRQPALRE